MKTNLGKPEKVIRLIFGTGIIAAGVYFESWWRVIGVIPPLTAFINWCPFYVPFGISTCKLQNEKTK